MSRPRAPRSPRPRERSRSRGAARPDAEDAGAARPDADDAAVPARDPEALPARRVAPPEGPGARLDDDARARVRGALLGLAWGDALGCPIEGWRAGAIAGVFDHYEALPEAYPLDRILAQEPKRLGRLRPLGLHSDDTQQALALLAVCMEGYAPLAWGEALVTGARVGAWRGTGRNFNSAVSALARGASPRRSGSSSGGIGAAMRIGPLGALFRDAPEALAEVSVTASLTTHADLRAAACAYATARAVADLTRGDDARQVAKTLPGAVAAMEHDWITHHAARGWRVEGIVEPFFSHALEASLGARSLERARARLTRAAQRHSGRRGHPNQGFALLGGVHALVLGLWPDADPDALLGDMMRMGYDTDTVGAICGSVLGARFGEGWIPVERLVDAQALDAWADALVDRGGPPESLAALLAREAAHTEAEARFQARTRSHR